MRSMWLLVFRSSLLAGLLLAQSAFAQELPPGDGDETREISAEPGASDEPEPEEGADEGLKAISIPMPPREGVEEIVVTGFMPENMVKDETVSTIGFDQQTLQLEGIKDIRDLSNFTPTLEIKSAFAASNPTIFIRGVGLDDFNANAASAVAIYQDGVYMQSPAGQLFQFFDTQNVVVLRGPQPTLYRNAEAGAILVESRKPSDELESYLTATYGNYNLVEVEGAVGGPILPDRLSGRLSASWAKRDGITENRCAAQSGQPDASQVPYPCNQTLFNTDQNGDGFWDRIVQPGLDQWTNDIDAYAARGQLLWKQSIGEGEMEWLLNGHGGQNRSRALQFQQKGVRFEDTGTDEVVPIPLPLFPAQSDFSGYYDADNGDPFAGDYDIDGPEDISLAGANLRGSWLFGDGYVLESLTAYEWHDRFTQENTDGGPRFLLESEYKDTAWQLSQQLDLEGHWSESETGSGTWQVGTYYLQEDLDVRNFYDVLSSSALDQQYTQKTRNFAAFAQSEYHLQPGCVTVSCDFTVIAGIRYNLEYKSLETVVCGVRAGGCASTLQGSGDDLWTGPGGEFSLAWNFSEDSSLYAKYSHGWKGGHFNGGATTQFDVITGVDPETVNSYEGGLRSYWFDSRLMLNLTGFYYDYENLQVFQLEQTPAGFPIPKLVNANDAVVYGIELDLGASPVAGLNLTYNFAWVESEYVDFTVQLPFKERPPRAPGQGPRPPVIFTKEFVYSGNPLIASPRFSMTGAVDYAIPLPGTILGRGLGWLIPRFSFSWKDDIFFDACSGKGALCNFPEGTFGQKAFWVFNSFLTWRSDNEQIEVTGWVRNFMDEQYKTQSFDLSREFWLILDAWAEPRTFGITATVNF